MCKKDKVMFIDDVTIIDKTLERALNALILAKTVIIRSKKPSKTKTVMKYAKIHGIQLTMMKPVKVKPMDLVGFPKRRKW